MLSRTWSSKKEEKFAICLRSRFQQVSGGTALSGFDAMEYIDVALRYGLGHEVIR